MSIGTAYLLFYFGNILAFLQVLLFFFIVPLFGVVTLGMLWKRATPAGGFWGFLVAICVSIGMWGYVHSFPQGLRPTPQVVVEKQQETFAVGRIAAKLFGTPEAHKTPTAVISAVDTVMLDGREKLARVVIDSGVVRTTNVPIPPAAVEADVSRPGLVVVRKEVTLPAQVPERGALIKVRVLVPEAHRADQPDSRVKFGDDGVSVVLRPGVQVQAQDITRYFAPADFNPDHVRWIARYPKASEMAVNMYSGFWTFVVCVTTAVTVSLFTRPKADSELRNVVMGLTRVPDEGPVPWYEWPVLWASLVGVVLVTINIIFW
jgi:solute:Na+ symporter, SSS family